MCNDLKIFYQHFPRIKDTREVDIIKVERKTDRNYISRSGNDFFSLRPASEAAGCCGAYAVQPCESQGPASPRAARRRPRRACRRALRVSPANRFVPVPVPYGRTQRAAEARLAALWLAQAG